MLGIAAEHPAACALRMNCAPAQSSMPDMSLAVLQSLGSPLLSPSRTTSLMLASSSCLPAAAHLRLCSSPFCLRKYSVKGCTSGVGFAAVVPSSRNNAACAAARRSVSEGGLRKSATRASACDNVMGSSGCVATRAGWGLFKTVSQDSGPKFEGNVNQGGGRMNYGRFCLWVHCFSDWVCNCFAAAQSTTMRW